MVVDQDNLVSQDRQCKRQGSTRVGASTSLREGEIVGVQGCRWIY